MFGIGKEVREKVLLSHNALEVQEKVLLNHSALAVREKELLNHSALVVQERGPSSRNVLAGREMVLLIRNHGYLVLAHCGCCYGRSWGLARGHETRTGCLTF